MRYTIRDGAMRPFSERAKTSLRYLLPLLVILAGVLVFSLSHGRGNHTPKPLTLGVYTIKSHNSPPNSNKSGGGSGGGSTASSGTTTASLNSPTSAQTTIAPVAASSDMGSISTAPAAPASGTGLTGGMGGGETGGGGGSGGSVSPPSTFPCVDITSNFSVTCTYTACTPPLSLVGHKAYFTTTGTCAVIN